MSYTLFARIQSLNSLKADLHGRILLTNVACDFCRARCLRHGNIVYDFHDIKLPVATIAVGF